MSGTRWSSSAVLSLVVLVLQNSSLVVMTRYSRTSIPAHKRYNASTMVLNQEIVKMILCIIIFAVENRNPGQYGNPSLAVLHVPEKSSVASRLWRVVYHPDSLKIAVPAALFTLQNYLLFIGLSNLDAMSFQVWSQTKLLFAAVFSVLLLGRRLSSMQWMALFILILGVLLTQQQQMQQKRGDESTSNKSEKLSQRPLLGIAACVISGISSSYAGVYFEKVVKTTAPSLAVRNIHLSLFGIPFSVVSLLFIDVFPRWQSGSTFEFWKGYDHWVTHALVLLNALGGLLVAVVMKYADNIVKGFATGMAVVVSGLMSFAIWGYTPEISFVIGCLLIVGATLLYHQFNICS